MSGLPAVYYLTAAAILLFITVSTIAWWMASGRRHVEATVAQARTESERIVRQAERDADSVRKETALEAREKAHLVAADDRPDRARATAGDRHARAGARRQDPGARRAHYPRPIGSSRTCARAKRRSPSRRRSATAALARAEQIVAERQRELQRVAGLSADEAREILLKQIEADARRDAANLVKRLETEARETAAGARPADHHRSDPAQRRRARDRDHRAPSSISRATT